MMDMVLLDGTTSFEASVATLKHLSQVSAFQDNNKRPHGSSDTDGLKIKALEVVLEGLTDEKYSTKRALRELQEVCVELMMNDQCPIVLWRCLDVISRIGTCSDSDFEIMVASVFDKKREPMMAHLRGLGRSIGGSLTRFQMVLTKLHELNDLEALFCVLNESMGTYPHDGLGNFQVSLAVHVLGTDAQKFLTHVQKCSTVTAFQCLRKVCFVVGLLTDKQLLSTCWYSLWCKSGKPQINSVESLSNRMAGHMDCYLAEFIFALVALMLTFVEKGNGPMMEETFRVKLKQAYVTTNGNKSLTIRWVWPLLCILRKNPEKARAMISIPACEALPLHVQFWEKAVQMLEKRSLAEQIDFSLHIRNKTSWFPLANDANMLKDVYMSALNTKSWVLATVLEMEHPTTWFLTTEEIQTLFKQFVQDAISEKGVKDYSISHKFGFLTALAFNGKKMRIDDDIQLLVDARLMTLDENFAVKASVTWFLATMHFSIAKSNLCKLQTHLGQFLLHNQTNQAMTNLSQALDFYCRQLYPNDAHLHYVNLCIQIRAGASTTPRSGAQSSSCCWDAFVAKDHRKPRHHYSICPPCGLLILHDSPCR